MNSLEALDKRSIIATYAEVLNSNRIFEEAASALNLGSAAIDYAHSAVVLPDANILELTTQGPNPQLVASLANEIGNQAVTYIEHLYSAYNINFLDAAIPPDVPYSPQPVRDSALAIGLGVIIGAVLAIVREQMRVPLETFLRRTAQDDESKAYTNEYVVERMDESVARHPDGIWSLGLIHLEGLDGYIDVMPQPVIQRILREITQKIRTELWGTDIVGRWEKTTYAVFMGDTKGSSATSSLGRLQLALSKPVQYTPDGETIALSPKIGIAQRNPRDPVPLVMEHAEKALKQATHEDTGFNLYKVQPF